MPAAVRVNHHMVSPPAGGDDEAVHSYHRAVVENVNSDFKSMYPVVMQGKWVPHHTQVRKLQACSLLYAFTRNRERPLAEHRYDWQHLLQ